MTGVRFALKGLSDTFEYLVYFLLMTIAWWVCIFTVVLAPPATMALFLHADPRNGSSRDRPSIAETWAFMRSALVRSWALTLVTLPILFLLAFNFFYYGNHTTNLGVLAPLWLVLFLLAVVVVSLAYAMATLEERGVKNSVLGALVLTGGRLPVVIPMLITLGVINSLGTVLVVPMAMFLPMTNAAVFNRLLLASRNIDVADPLEPTAERLAEGKEKRKWLRRG